MIARLLHYANASPPRATRAEFYALKSQILKRRAKAIGVDWQHIRGKPCWSCEGTGGLYEPGGCYKCCGWGWHKRPKWVTLARYRLGRYVFHRPVSTEYDEPYPGFVPDITGYVEHSDYGAKSDEAVLWLYLLTGNFRLFWTQWREDEAFRPGLLTPLCFLMRLRYRVRRALPRRWQCDYCGKRRWTHMRYFVCEECREGQYDLPF